MSDEALVRRYAGRAVPRYTSYPTAAEFTAAVGPQDHARWLGRLDPAEPISLYVHVPYCRALCHYCGCHAKMAIREDVFAAYRHRIETEIELVSRHLPGRLKVARLHWGGGTPTILGGEALASIVETLGRHFAFEADFEHAIELDPRRLDRPLAESLAALGINRASFGVQDLDPFVQKAIGRVQPLPVVTRGIDHLHAVGINRINLDLMYGLPGQTEESIEKTCQTVIDLDPDRVAVYGYAHMPARRRNQRLIDPASLPGAEQRFAQSQMVAAIFAAAGYVQVGIDHYARPDDSLAKAVNAGRLHRNFQGYTDDDRPTLIGFGSSAISRLADGYVQNITGNTAYAHKIDAGEMPTARGHRFVGDDLVRARIIEALMCDFKVDLHAVAAGRDYADELALLRPLAADGLVQVNGARIEVTESGRPFVRLVAAVFDQFRAVEPTRFSRAV